MDGAYLHNFDNLTWLQYFEGGLIVFFLFNLEGLQNVVFCFSFALPFVLGT